MGNLQTNTILNGDPSLIPEMAALISEYLTAEGYEVSNDDIKDGGTDISVAHRQLFKTIANELPAVKITLTPESNAISFEIGVGIFRQPTIPTKIATKFSWPLILIEVWNHVKQNCLDAKVLAMARSVIYKQENPEVDFSNSTTPPPLPESATSTTMPPLPDSATD